MASIKKLLFGISPNETLCEQRGFEVTDPAVKSHIEKVGESFVYGYHVALVDSHYEYLQPCLEKVDKDFQGFAYEGTGMALALLDLLTPWKKNRLNVFIQESGQNHIYMLHVGAGWAMAKIPWGLSYQSKLDSLLGWLAIDGYGFHQGYFHWPKSITKQQIPYSIKGYAKQVFDQGLGRSFWFVKGADPKRILKTIQAFPTHRHEDLWSGVGLAAAYAGGVDETTLKLLVDLSTSYHSHLAQGTAFAAKARLRANNPTNHTELACQIICNMNAVDAAALTDEALHDLTAQQQLPAYQIWRQRIQNNFL